uniref:Macaca fascicularis brain cDNA clone: QflA-19966, similar to human O-acyltransferase (membrane bound) domain containing 1(OACT1), mRNA, RefSeq: XM_371801.2 n=1 Tax=Macaca fascicularis TaxID=9541 RepID=I7GLY5_MACFA|nr:unnamed protein product [Macaca fascicularis]
MYLCFCSPSTGIHRSLFVIKTHTLLRF